MTDRELEQQLRAWYQGRVDAAGAAPMELYASVSAIPDEMPEGAGAGGSSGRLAAWLRGGPGDAAPRGRRTPGPDPTTPNRQPPASGRPAAAAGDGGRGTGRGAGARGTPRRTGKPAGSSH